jgi:uncharacterized protein (TIGR03089 family)
VPSPNDTPWGLLSAIAGSDPTRPRLTWYDDQPGPTAGERIELSGRVLATWAAKAANLLQEDLDAGPGSVVAVDLPTHWRAAYWLFAVWAVGAQAVVGPAEGSRPPDVIVTGTPQRWAAAGGPVVAVSLPALARQWAGEPLPAGTVDEARELATYGDGFVPWSAPAAPDPSLAAARTAAEAAGLAPGARVMTSAGPADAVRSWLPAWTVDGSLVLVRPAGDGHDEERAAQRAAAERVTNRG